MNRRSFLTTLSSGVVGLSLVQMEWVPTPIAPVKVADLSPIERATQALLREMVLIRLHTRAQFVPGSYHLGDHGLNRQYWVMTDAGIGDGDFDRFTECWLRPAAHRLSNRSDLVKYGALPVDMVGVEAAVAHDDLTGIAVRGVRQWDVGTDQWLCRFDLLGATA